MLGLGGFDNERKGRVCEKWGMEKGDQKVTYTLADTAVSFRDSDFCERFALERDGYGAAVAGSCEELQTVFLLFSVNDWQDACERRRDVLRVMALAVDSALACQYGLSGLSLLTVSGKLRGG